MSFLKLPDDARFSNKTILMFIFPIFIEHVLIAAMPIIDTMVASHLPESANAVAAIALISRIDQLVKQVFVALATGGSVVVAQYIGANRLKEANRALKLSLVIILSIAFCLSAVLLTFKVPIIKTLFSTISPEVMTQSKIYFTVTILSYPFMALYNIGSASFRAMRESKIPFIASAVMFSFNVIFKYIFVGIFNMGIMGTGLSLLIGYAAAGIFELSLLISKKHTVYIENIRHLEWNGGMASSILKVGVPSGIENGLFNFGSLLLQALVSSLGLVAIDANHIGHNLAALMTTYTTSFAMCLMPFVSQCMGANRPDEAEFYAKHIIKMEYAVMAVLNTILLISAPWLVGLYGLDPEISSAACKILYIYYGTALILYPQSFAKPYALRGAGDTKFTMYVSVLSMFLFRISFAYLLVHTTNLGVLAIWVAMVSDWVIRSILFNIRFIRGKWKLNKVIK